MMSFTLLALTSSQRECVKIDQVKGGLFCIENTELSLELPGASSPGPPPGAKPLDPLKLACAAHFDY